MLATCMTFSSLVHTYLVTSRFADSATPTQHTADSPPLLVWESDSAILSLDSNTSVHALYHTLCALDLWDEHKTTVKKTAVGKRTIPQVIFNNKELQHVTTMYFQWIVNKTGKCPESGNINEFSKTLEPNIVNYVICSRAEKGAMSFFGGWCNILTTASQRQDSYQLQECSFCTDNWKDISLADSLELCFQISK